MASRTGQPVRRSLDALFGAPPAGGVPAVPVQIDVARLSPNPFQPRTEFDPATLAELGRSFARHGVLQSLLVRRAPGELGAGDTYQIAAGERRWRAAQLAGLATVPCDVRDLDDDAMEEIALTENIQREDLTDIELAYALSRLLERHPDLSRRALSESLGKAHNYADNKLKLIGDPRIEAAVRDGTLGPTVAMEIADLDDEAARADLLARAAAGERLRVRDVQARRPRPEAVTATDHPATPAPPRAPVQGAEATVEARAGATGPTTQGPQGSPVTPAQTASASADPRRVALRPFEQPGYGADQEEGWGADYDLPLTPADRERLAAERAEVLAMAAAATPATDAPTVRLRDLRIIQLREGRDGDPRQLDEADHATVLRILRADLAWLEDIERKADR